MIQRINISLSVNELTKLAINQIENFFPDSTEVSFSLVKEAVKKSLPRLEHSFSHVNNKYFFNGKNAIFDHLHGDQYAAWLYILSNEVYRLESSPFVAKKIFLLNKTLHGCDIYFEVELPEIFLLVHPLGTVLGRGDYQDYLTVYQRCGVGSNHGVYPTFGSHTTLRPGSSVLGNCNVGNNCSLAAGSLLLDNDLPDNTLYIGNPKQFVTREQKDTLPIWRVI